MAYQNGSYPGHAPGYAQGYAYPQTQTYPAYPGYPPPGEAVYPGPAGPPQPPPPPSTFRAAPVHVHIVAVLQYLTGLVLILGSVVIGVVTFNDGKVGDSELPASLRGAVTGAGLAIAALALVAGLIAISIGRRLHRGRRGARIVVLVLSAASLGLNVWSLVTTGVADPLSGLVLPTLYLVLLNTPQSRGWFRRPRY